MSCSRELAELINSTTEKSIEENVSLTTVYDIMVKRKQEIQTKSVEVSCITKNEKEEKFKEKTIEFIKVYDPQARELDIIWTTAILCMYYRIMQSNKKKYLKQDYVRELMEITKKSEASCRSRLNGQQGKFILENYFLFAKNCKLLILDFDERNELLKSLIYEIQKQ